MRTRSLAAGILLTATTTAAHAGIVVFDFNSKGPGSALNPSGYTSPVAGTVDVGGCPSTDICAETLSFEVDGIGLDVTGVDTDGTDDYYAWYDLAGFSSRGGIGAAPTDWSSSSEDNVKVGLGEGLTLSLDLGTAIATSVELILFGDHVPLGAGSAFDIDGLSKTIDTATESVFLDASDLAAIGDSFTIEGVAPTVQWYLGGAIVTTSDTVIETSEPGLLGLLGLGMLGLAVARRRQR